MNDEKLIKEYVKVVLQEGGYFRRPNRNHVKSGSFFSKIKKFFTGQSPEEKIVENWIRLKKVMYDFDDVAIKEQALEFVKNKIKRFSQGSQDAEGKIKTSHNEIIKMIEKALDKKFESQMK